MYIDASYFNSFGVDLIPKQIWKFIDDIKIKVKFLRIQAYHSIMYAYFLSDSLISYLIDIEKLKEFISLFSPNIVKESYREIRNIFTKKSMKKICPSLNDSNNFLN